MNAHTWRESIQTLTHPRVITMFLFGISAGLPLALIFGSLSLWLREAGVDRSVVTFFSWAALGYSFKFVWAPIVDQLPLPFLSTRLGRRRAWILFAQFSVIASILVMAFINPALSDLHLKLMALACIILGFSSATQDIVIDAYRIESTPSDLQALTAASYITGYRVGMLLSGAGALYLAETLGSETGAYHYAAWRINVYKYGGDDVDWRYHNPDHWRTCYCSKARTALFKPKLHPLFFWSLFSPSPVSCWAFISAR